MKYTELERLQVTVGAKSNYFKLLEGRTVQQKALFEKTQGALEKLLAETDGRPDAVFMEMTAHRDLFCNALRHLSSYLSTLSVELNKTCRQLIAVRTEIGTVCGRFTKQKRFTEDVEQKTMDI